LPSKPSWRELAEMTVYFTAVALTLNGVTAGILVASLCAPIPLLLSMPAGPYIRAKKFLTPRYDPAMPITIGANVIADIIVAVLTARLGDRVAFSAAAALLLVVIIVSVARNVPVNNWEMTLDPAAPPAEWADIDPRGGWHRWHLVRTTALVAAFVVTVAGAVLA
jgi:Anthrone oxygenase